MRRTTLYVLLSTLLVGWIGFGLFAPRSDAAPPQRGDISGLVLANGSPAAGATVQLYGGPGFIDYVAETTSDSAGGFRFRRIAVGNYSVSAYRLAQGRACSGNAPVTVVNGQTTNGHGRHDLSGVPSVGIVGGSCPAGRPGAVLRVELTEPGPIPEGR